MRSLKKVTEDSANTEKGGDMENQKESYRVVLANISKFMDTLHAVSDGCFISKGNLTVTVRYNRDGCEKQQIKELLDIILGQVPGTLGQITKPDMVELINIAIYLEEDYIDTELKFW